MGYLGFAISWPLRRRPKIATIFVEGAYGYERIIRVMMCSMNFP